MGDDNTYRPPSSVIEAFGGSDAPMLLSGGSQCVYRAGDLVLKKIRASSLENTRSLELAPWLSSVLSELPGARYRLQQPVSASDGRWMIDGGFMAWMWMEGRTASPDDDIPSIIVAAEALHRDLKGIPAHPRLLNNRTAFGKAHEECWGPNLGYVHPVVGPMAQALASRCRPLHADGLQVIHGDLNAANIILAPGLAPGFIDFTPYVSTMGFALAMMANWLGPRMGRADILRHFQGIPDFRQLLLRAALRMVLIVSHLGGVDRWEEEKKAAELVLEYAASII